MALEVQRLSKKEEPQMDDLYEVTERLALTEDGRVVSEGDADARWLYAIPGQSIPLAEAQRYGLVPGDEPAEEPEVESTEDAPAEEAPEQLAAEEETEDAPAVDFPPEVKRSRGKR